MKDFVVINFDECFKSMREAFDFKLGADKNLTKVAQLFYTFLTTPEEKKKYVELIKKMLEAKIMMQSSYSDDCLGVYNIEISDHLDPEL